MIKVSDIKKDFPIFERQINGNKLTYLDSGATSQKPNQVIDVMSDVYKNNNFRGTDDEGSLKIEFYKLFNAELKISIKEVLAKPTIIYGTKGKMIIPNPWLPNKDTSIEVTTSEKNYIKKISSKYSL